MTSTDKPKAHYLEISQDAAGQRIDNFLLTYLKGVPKSWIYRILRRGEVRVNKGRVKPTRRLVAGDKVRVPPLRMAKPNSLAPAQKMRKQVEQSIIHEDTHLLVINKPSGLAVHGGSGISHGVIEILRDLRPQAPYLELAHRLDRDTSGCLLVAKKRSALRRLQQLQSDGAINKQYLTLLKGAWRKDQMRIDAPLRKNTLQGGERVVRVDASGKPAATRFTVQQRLNASMLVNARLETGRTHQIRVHAAHANAPILGDEKYGDPAANQTMRQSGLNRLFLHAWRLDFPWPEREAPYHFEAPLPPELAQVLERLNQPQ